MAEPRVERWVPPPEFDEYRLLTKIGKGGMGEVYVAQDTLLDRLVAVKFINLFNPDVAARLRFLTEARAAARLQHPHIVSIYRVGEIDERPFIITEFIRGRSLDRSARPMPWRQVLEIGIGLARGLAAAHRVGVLHRDIKPANVILSEDGGVKLVDFGLAEFVGPSAGPVHKVEFPKQRAPLQSDSDVSVVGEAPTVDSVVGEAPTVDSVVGEAPTVDSVVCEAPTMDSMVGEQPAGHSPANQAMNLAIPSDPSGTVFLGTRMAGHNGQAAIKNAHWQLQVQARDTPSEEASPSSAPGPRQYRVWGTPQYIPAEIWLGEPATRRSDVYSLGVLLFELCAGHTPFAEHARTELPRVVTETDPPTLASVVADVDPGFAAIIDRCLQRDANQRYASADDIREALESLLAAEARGALPQGNPYRGLLAFEAEHRALFFGRDAEIRAVLERLRFQSFVLVAGDSGAGKSSLCRAGVIPWVGDGALGDKRSWNHVSMVPGTRPLTEFASVLAAHVELPGADLVDALGERPLAVVRALQTGLNARRGLLIFIDQLEELVTVSDPGEVEPLARALGHLVEGRGNVRILATARSDFLGRLAGLPGLGHEIASSLYLLQPMPAERVRDAVIGPARAKGVSFESDALVATLVESAAQANGSLPLLQFALAELWETRSTTTGVITEAALEEMGGVGGALARHADSVLLSLPRAQRSIARVILTALVTAEGTRARRGEDELVAGNPDARAALEILVHERLLVAREVEEGAVYEVAHEALIQSWDTMRRWLDEDSDIRAVRERLSVSAAEWERLGRAREALWGERQLAEARLLEGGELNARSRAFLDASRRAARRKRWLRRLAILTAPVLVLALYTAVQIHASRDLDRRVTVQVKRGAELYARARVRDAELAELRARAFAAFDKKDLERGEALWARARDLSIQVDQLLRSASQAFEAALTVDGNRQDVRDVLGDILFTRAVAAERDNHPSLRDELVQRLEVYDASGERRRQWNAPATLAIDTTPAGARVTIAKYVRDKHGKRRLEDARQLGPTPIAAVELAQGSYLLTFTAKDRVEVRYPIMSGRDEQLAISVPMPRLSDIPEGYIYIPPGRFLFGSTADEMVRREFLRAVPLHQVVTDDYLIARHETTYADWLEYLRSLPAEERAHYTGNRGRSAMSSVTKFVEGRDGVWQVTLRPTVASFTVSAGDTLTYPTRTRRADQDWLRFPVSDMPYADTRAYAEWLDASGRVPGARLCTDYEWERAARGADARTFPHGDRLDPDDANFDETYGKETSNMGPDEVGSHASSRSPFGVDDMAGNVFEWVESSLEAEQVLGRGGAYFIDKTAAQLTNRFVLDKNFQDPTLGLRICASFSHK